MQGLPTDKLLGQPTDEILGQLNMYFLGLLTNNVLGMPTHDSPILVGTKITTYRRHADAGPFLCFWLHATNTWLAYNDKRVIPQSSHPTPLGLFRAYPGTILPSLSTLL